MSTLFGFFLALVPLKNARAMSGTEFKRFKQQLFGILNKVTPVVEEIFRENDINLATFNLGNY